MSEVLTCVACKSVEVLVLYTDPLMYRCAICGLEMVDPDPNASNKGAPVRLVRRPMPYLVIVTEFLKQPPAVRNVVVEVGDLLQAQREAKTARKKMPSATVVVAKVVLTLEGDDT